MMTVNTSAIGRRLLPFLIALLFTACAVPFPIQRGEELALASRWDEAVRAYQEAVRTDPRNYEARLGLARALLEAAAAHVQQGQELERANRLSDAEAEYRRALAFDGENRAALAGIDRLARAAVVQDRLARARDRRARGELRAALAEVQAALRMNPEHPEAQALKRDLNIQIQAESARAEDAERQATQLFSRKPVTLRFRDTELKEALEVFARLAEVNVFTDESLQPKRITTFFQNLPLREAFNLILTSNRLFAKKVAENTVIVVPDNPGKRQQYDELSVQTFYLTDADAKVAVNLLRTILNTRQVFVNEKLNALVVRETPEKLELARKVLEANDRGVAEVEIDIEVLEVDRNSLQKLGIDFSPRTLSATLNFPSTIPLTTFWSSLKFGSTLTLTNPSLILNLARSDGTTKGLASPTIRILDRQKARLLIGERRPFQISSISSNTAGTTTTTTGTTSVGTTTETRVEYRDLGLKLTLTPTVHLNDEVTVELNFEVSSVGAPIAGVTNGDLLPPVNTRNLDTFIKVKNGETRLLGGLYQENDSVANSRIPFLGDIPGVGRLFTTPDENRTRTDVLISLTPRIVKILERPDPEIETFSSGTADSFGPAAPTAPIPVPVPVTPQRPATPGAQPPAAPGAPGPIAPVTPGAPGPRP